MRAAIPLLPLLLFFSTPARATPVPPERFFPKSERQVFTLKYIDTTAGECELETLGPTTREGRAVLHFRATVRTSGLIGVVYPFKQTVDLFVDPVKAEPVFVDIRIEDRKKRQHTQIRLDPKTKRGEEIEDSTEPGEPSSHRRKQWDIPAEAQSLWSILTFLRLQPLAPGTKVAFPVAHDQKNAVFSADVESAENGAVRVKVLNSFTDVFYPNIKEQPLLWFSGDERRTLQRFEFKHRIGRVFAILRSGR